MSRNNCNRTFSCCRPEIRWFPSHMMNFRNLKVSWSFSSTPMLSKLVMSTCMPTFQSASDIISWSSFGANDPSGRLWVSMIFAHSGSVHSISTQHIVPQAGSQPFLQMLSILAESLEVSRCRRPPSLTSLSTMRSSNGTLFNMQTKREMTLLRQDSPAGTPPDPSPGCVCIHVRKIEDTEILEQV